MSQPLPPDPMSAAKASLGAAAADSAQNAARRAMVRQIKGYLPKVFWPLIPGEGGSVAGNVQAQAKKKAWAAVTGCIVSALFFAFFAVAFLGFGLVVAYAVMTS